MREVLIRHVAVLLVYVVLAVLMSLPLVLVMGDHVIGTGGDPWQTLWRFEHRWELLQDDAGEVLRGFMGGGEPRLVNLSVWPWMWIHAIFGQPLTYNLVWLLSYVLSGYGMYALVSYLFKEEERTKRGESGKSQVSNLIKEAPAVLAGVVYMFLPYHVAHSYGHFGAMQLQWLPLAILALFFFFRRAIWQNMLLLWLALTVQAWSEHHYALWLLIFILFWLIWERAAVKRWWQQTSARWCTVGLIVLLIVSVVMPYLPTLRLASMPDTELALGVSQAIRFSADVFSYVTPASFHPIWGGLAHTLFGQHFTGNISEATQFLGLVPLLLVIFFHRQVPDRQKKLWLWVAGIFFVLSLGPRLHLVGLVLPIPLPYALVDSWPVFSAVRAVARAGALVGLAWVVLLAWVLRGNLHRGISVVALSAVLIVELLFLPVPLQSIRLPAVYGKAVDAPGSALIELPAATNYRAASRSLYASLRHGKHVMGNIALERALSEEELAEGRSLPALRQLLYLRTTHLLEDRKEFFDQDMAETFVDVLRWIDGGMVIVHTDSLSAVQLGAVDHFLSGVMRYSREEIDDTILYRLPGELPVSDGIFLARDDGWQNVGYDADRASHFAEVQEEATVTIYNVNGEERVVQLAFEVPSESDGDLMIMASEITEDLLLREKLRVVQLRVPNGPTVVTFRNEGGGKSIIMNPWIEVGETGDL